MVGAASVVDRHGRRVPVLERCEPFFEDRAEQFISLEIDSPDLTRSVVEVVIHRELFVRRFLVYRRFGSSKQREGCGVGSVTNHGKILGDVTARTKQSLLFTRP